MKRIGEITNANSQNLALLNKLGVEAGNRYMKVAAPPAAFDPPEFGRAR